VVVPAAAAATRPKEVDRVVDQGSGYVLVEKIVAVDEVVAADPRSRGG